MTRSREWLLLNAVESWLHHYSSPNTPTVEQYKQLRDEFHAAYMATISKDVATPTPKPTRKRTKNDSQRYFIPLRRMIVNHSLYVCVVIWVQVV
jgi:hypothetical protein